jgi:hypothetical protein
MRGVIIGAAVLIGIGVASRHFGPRLVKLAMVHCEAMFEQMPADFPPKRMMDSIEEIRKQNSRILQHMDLNTEQRILTAVN